MQHINNQSLLEKLRQFVGIKESHLQLLQHYADKLLERKDVLAKEYCWYLFKTPETSCLIDKRVPGGIDTLLAEQIEYVSTFVQSDISMQRVENIIAMGKMYYGLGVNPVWIAGGYERYFAHFSLQITKQSLPFNEHNLLSGAIRKRVLLDQLLQLYGYQQAVDEDISHRGKHVLTMSRFYEVQRAVNLAIVRSASHDELFESVCQACVGGQVFDYAWVCVPDVDSGYVHSVVAFPAEMLPLLQAQNLSLFADTPYGLGPVGKAFRTRQVQVVNDAMTDVSLLPWLDIMVSNHVRSMVMAPLCVSDKVVAVFALASRSVNYFNDARVQLLEMMADEMAHALERLEALERSRKAESDLAFLSLYDPLTSLPNRQLMQDYVRQQLDASQRGRCAVVTIAIDGFHEINAHLGYQVGDIILCEVAKRLREVIEPDGRVGRIGASRFVGCLDHREPLEPLINRLLHHLNRQVECQGVVVDVRSSIGVALEPENEVIEAATLFRRADLALSLAKEAGGGVCRYYQVALDADIQRMHKLRSQFSKAIGNGELVLFFQPKIDLLNRQVKGVEALVRWRRDGKLFAPGEFFPAIEKTDLMRELDWWVLSESFCLAVEWFECGKGLPISVNLSAMTLKHDSFIPRIEDLVSTYRLPKGYLELEVLESISLQEAVQVTGKLERCRELGLTIALDDFGTGASSLIHLQQLPFDTVKIDQRFVRMLLDMPGNEAIIRSMLAFTHHTGRELVVEGVESAEIWERLLEIGCVKGQGYGISPPIESCFLHDWVTDWEENNQLDYSLLL